MRKLSSTVVCPSTVPSRWKYPTPLENSTTFLRAVREGTLHGRATPLTRGRRTQVWEVTIEGDDGRVAAQGNSREIRALIERNPGDDWQQVDDVWYGCANQAGEDNRNVARMSSLLAGPDEEYAPFRDVAEKWRALLEWAPARLTAMAFALTGHFDDTLPVLRRLLMSGLPDVAASNQAILREAEKEADVILWDGGNNDIPFYKPDLWITVADPLRPGHEALRKQRRAAVGLDTPGLEVARGEGPFHPGDEMPDIGRVERVVGQREKLAIQVDSVVLPGRNGRADVLGRRRLAEHRQRGEPCEPDEDVPGIVFVDFEEIPVVGV